MEMAATLDPESILQLQALLESMSIIRIDDERYPLPHQGIGYRVDLNLGGVRDLLNAGDYEHDILACTGSDLARLIIKTVYVKVKQVYTKESNPDPRLPLY